MKLNRVVKKAVKNNLYRYFDTASFYGTEKFIAEAINQSGIKREEFFIASAASKPADGGDLHEGIAAKLRAENIPYTKHTARQVTADDYKKFDKIVCMDKGNIEQVTEICGGDPEGKIKLLLSYCGENNDIPWDKNGFVETFIDIDRGCKALLQTISQK